MSNFNKRILDILSQEEISLNENIMGGITGFGQNKTDLKKKFLDEDAERKREERAREKNKDKRIKDKTKSSDIPIDPKDYLVSSPLRFTPKQAFVANLISYLETDKKSYINEAISLLEEYPKLKIWVQEESSKHLPKNPFSLYVLSEWLNEDVGSTYTRPDGKYKIWHLTEASLENKKHQHDDSMILECHVSPDKVLIYIPAFTKLMEELIFSGKIDEPYGNPLLKARQHKECITDGSVNSGLITKIHKKE